MWHGKAGQNKGGKLPIPGYCETSPYASDLFELNVETLLDKG